MQCLGLIDAILLYVIIYFAVWFFVGMDGLGGTVIKIVGFGILINFIVGFIAEDGTWTDMICMNS
jgi:hypothetical protein